MWVRECGSVSDDRRIKDDEIGILSGPNLTAIGQAQPIRHRRRHDPNGMLYRDDGFVPYILAQHPRIGAVGAWMHEHPATSRRVEATSIGADLDPWLLHLQLEVVFGH